MQFENIALIAAVEVAVVLLIFCLILGVQNHSLRKLIKKLQSRMSELVQELKVSKQTSNTSESSQPPAAPAQEKSYTTYIDEQLIETKQHHTGLDPDRDIVLDLAPDSDIPKRSAALRYAVLLAEKEAFSPILDADDVPDWSLIRNKYQQIFDFYEDYTADSSASVDNEEINSLNEELINAKKRINNLERFKALYFELEEKWDASKEKAELHFKDLNNMASEVADEAKFKGLLESYHSAYSDIDDIIGGGQETDEVTTEPGSGEGGTTELSSGELRHLRSVAADQHKIITDLQAQLQAAITNEDKNNIVEGLKAELDKQKAFIQESETCIQLMEDELQTKNNELEQLKGRLKTLPGIRTQLQELKKQKDEYEIKVYSLTSDNRKLSKKLREEKGSLAVDNGESAKLKKELRDLEVRYANLEEKYLDLKLNQ